MAMLCSVDHSATSAKWKARVHVGVPSLPISQRYAKISRRQPNDSATVKAITRDERVDSATDFTPLDQKLPIEQIDQTRFQHLTSPIRHKILQYALAEDEPIHPQQVHSEDSTQQQAHLPPLAHAVPSLAPEISIHLPTYFHTNSFAFDLRTSHGSTTFKTWVRALGPLAAQTQSLRLTHWTTWWGFGHSSWTSAADTTHFSRDSAGNLKATRTLSTPEVETCSCGVLKQLHQIDSRFDLSKFRSIRTLPEFVACLRHPYQSRWPLPLTDAGRLFAALLDE